MSRLTLMGLSILVVISMTIVRFQGQEFRFPQGATQEQIGQALNQYMAQGPAAKGIPSQDSDAAKRTELPMTPVESYLQEEEVLQAPTGLTSEQQNFADDIATIETGGLAERGVRTMVKPAEGKPGSSAYGKYQITRGLLRGAIDKKFVELTAQELEAADELLRRQDIALTVGGRDRVDYQKGGNKYGLAQQWAKAYGYEDVEAFLDDFDYGGTLGLADDGDFQVLYESFARKLLNKTLEQANGDAIQAAAVWHGGPKGAGKATELYKEKMRKLLERRNGTS